MSQIESSKSNGPNQRKFKWFWEDLELYLSKHQLKQTKQRVYIIDRFLELDTHIDAEGLHNDIKSKGVNVGLATIYRTLNLLEKAKLVEQRAFADGRTLYELNTPNEHHDHLVCSECDVVIEFENKEIEDLQIEVAKKFGFKLTNHRLDLFGICPKCQN